MSETFTYNPVPEGSKPEPKLKSPRTATVAGNTAKDKNTSKRKGGEFLESKARKFNVIPSNGG